MVLLLDIGNTRTHFSLADRRIIRRGSSFPTAAWRDGKAASQLQLVCRRKAVDTVVVCSVVPEATTAARRLLGDGFGLDWLQLDHKTACALIGIDYPKPGTIGPDRLANVIAARHLVGAPCLAADFGTAVTLDVVDHRGRFVGGIIAPGLNLLSRALHENTALLPKVEPAPFRGFLGRSTHDAMQSGIMNGFHGLARELVRGLQNEIGGSKVPVIATGGDASLASAHVPEITRVEPLLTLEGLRLLWINHQGQA
jgi:type III pantothenate kinase